VPVGSRKILQNQVYVYLVAYHLHHHRLPIKNPGNPWLYAAALRPGFIPRWIARSNLAPRVSNRVSRTRSRCFSTHAASVSRMNRIRTRPRNLGSYRRA
jgi:hypothetical protein